MWFYNKILRIFWTLCCVCQRIVMSHIITHLRTHIQYHLIEWCVCVCEWFNQETKKKQKELVSHNPQYRQKLIFIQSICALSFLIPYLFTRIAGCCLPCSYLLICYHFVVLCFVFAVYTCINTYIQADRQTGSQAYTHTHTHLDVSISILLDFKCSTVLLLPMRK